MDVTPRLDLPLPVAGPHRLDETTRRIGRIGVAAARQVLAEAAARAESARNEPAAA